MRKSLMDRPLLKPQARWTSSRTGKLTKLWWGEYTIKPPSATPFLPADEAIKGLVRTLPGTILQKINRSPGGDSFTIATRENIFRSRATPLEKAFARRLLTRVGEMALSERYVPPVVRGACDALLTLTGMKSLRWFDKRVTLSPYSPYQPYGPSNSIYEGPHAKEKRALKRLCGSLHPFIYEAAQQ